MNISNLLLKTNKRKQVKCLCCESEIKTFIRPYTTENKWFYKKAVFLTYCQKCYDDLTLEQIIKIWKYLGFNNILIKSKCFICKKWSKKYVYFLKTNFIVRPACLECLTCGR